MYRLCVREIGHVVLYFSGCKCLCHCVLVNEKVTGKIQNDNAILHLLEGILVDHTLCAVKCRHMKRDVIALLENRVEARRVLDIS